MKKRVVVTGIGMLSIGGMDKESFWNGILEGSSSFTEINDDFWGEGFSEKYGIIDRQKLGETEDKYLIDTATSYDRCCKLALTAASMAYEDSGLNDNASGISPSKTGVSVGTTHGELGVLEQMIKENASVSYGDIHSRMDNYNISAAIARKINATGDVILHSDACASGNIAFSHAFEMIRSGRLERVIAGGVDTDTDISLGAFSCLRAVAHDKVRPFDKNRSGIILSAGAGMLVLESYESARARNAHIYCEILGQGQSNDAFSMASMDPEAKGIISAMEKAVRDSDISPEDIDYICLHGTGTNANDACEMLAVKEFFGDKAKNITATSIKGTLGHSLGAAAALELAACALISETGIIPPNHNLTDLDESCVFRIPTQPVKLSPEVIMNSSYAFGGSNNCVILKKIGEE